jgi:hypothetical protein
LLDHDLGRESRDSVALYVICLTSCASMTDVTPPRGTVSRVVRAHSLAHSRQRIKTKVDDPPRTHPPREEARSTSTLFASLVHDPLALDHQLVLLLVLPSRLLRTTPHKSSSSSQSLLDAPSTSNLRPGFRHKIFSHFSDSKQPPTTPQTILEVTSLSTL